MSDEMTNKEAIEFMKNMMGEESGRAIGKSGFYAELCGYHVQALKKGIAALEAELATKTCNKQIAGKLEDAELARDSEETCNNKQVISKLVASRDCISRQAAIDCLTATKLKKFDFILQARAEIKKLPPVTPKQTEITLESAIDYLNSIGWMQEHDRILTESAQSVTPKQRTGWIPLTYRSATDEEKKDLAERTGYDEEDIDTILNCQLPEDGETVLITDRLGNVEVDTFINDCDGCYFECNCDMEDVRAWMPLPKPYESYEKQCADCNHYGKLSLDCGRCDDDCSMFEPQESEVRE